MSSRFDDTAVAEVVALLARSLGDEALALRTAYRLLYAGLARRAGALLEDVAALRGTPAAGLPAVVLADTGAALTAVLDRLPPADPDVPPWGPALETAVALGALHQRLLGRDPDARKGSGSWFTPPALVGHLLDEALEPTLDEAEDPGLATVLDPACGSGVFLVAAAQRIAARDGRGHPAERRARAVQQVHGTDLDAAAVELARCCLWLLLVERGVPAPMPGLHLRVADALLGPPPAQRFDVVVGNPPFLNRLERRTAPPRGTAQALADVGDGALGAYTDVSAVFLHRAPRWVRPGGRVGLVQPQSVLAARDAAGVRRSLAAGCSLESLWASDRPVFEGTSVLTCAVVLRAGGTQGPVRRRHGPGFTEVPAREVSSEELAGEWSFLLAAGLGVPEPVLPAGSGVVGDLAHCTADFRDQYYGLAPAVREAVDCRKGVPLVTTGLIEPAGCLWGARGTRFLKHRWSAPVVDLAALSPALTGWATSRLVPKVLVGTQGAVVEAVADPAGAWLPSVPTITVAAPQELLWHLLAVLLAPPVAVHAATRYAGTALTMRAIKLSARQVAALPLPVDREEWDAGAALARRAQERGEQRGGADRDDLRALGATMCTAYGLDDRDGAEVLGWWLDRLR